MALSLLFVGGAFAQLVSSPENNATPSPAPEPLLEKVMTDLPGYGKSPAPALVAASSATTEVAPETVHLPPLVVVGRPRLRLAQSEALTPKAWAAELFKRYDYSAFSAFEHREDLRLRNMAELQDYAENLLLVGDVGEGRAIKKESSRLFLRQRDPESDYVVSIFNPRIR